MQILLLSAHTLWSSSLRHNLLQFCGVTSVEEISNINDSQHVVAALNSSPDLILVTSPGYDGSELEYVRDHNLTGYAGRLFILCSRYALPDLSDLKKNGVHGILSTAATLNELEYAICAVMRNPPESIQQQYLQTLHSLKHYSHVTLTSHEREIVQLIASDLSDQQIADRLSVSVRTINNQVRIICAKLGVRTRYGAVGSAFSKGLITPHAINQALSTLSIQ